MLTLFSCPKPFTHAHNAVIQRNAMASWTRLHPRPEIFVFGDEAGTADVCRELNVRHVPSVACNEFGTPLLSDIFEKAERLGSHDLLCYVNADIMFMSDFLPAVRRVAERMNRFVLFSQRWDTDVRKPWDFSAVGWEERLCELARRCRPPGPLWGLADFFVFRRGAFGRLPPFAIGRTAFDNWLIYRARSRNVSVVEATEAIMVVHQKHDYSHHPQDAAGVWRGPEAQRNLKLAGGRRFTEFGLWDVTHLLTPGGLRRARGWAYFVRSLETAPLLHPSLAPLEEIFRMRHLPARLLGVVRRVLKGTKGILRASP